MVNQKILTLDEYGKDRFVKELKRLGEQNNLYDKRNREWFEILPNSFEKYIDW